MAHPKKQQVTAAARARGVRHPVSQNPPNGSSESLQNIAHVLLSDPPSPAENSAIIVWEDKDSNEDCEYDGTDEYDTEADSDSDFTDSESSDFDEEIIETLKVELASLSKPGTVNEVLDGQSISRKDWKKSEANRKLGYTGNTETNKPVSERSSARTQRNRQYSILIALAKDSSTDTVCSNDLQIVMMRNMFTCQPTVPATSPNIPTPSAELTPVSDSMELTLAELVDYLSDHSEDDSDDSSSNESDDEQRTNSLQEYRARAIQSYLVMVVQRGHLTVDASERAAESQGFAAKWGGQSVWKSTRTWIKEEASTSQKG
ncbi:hypothetical protein K438DRAFT_1761471 [Mycena galopus ATCC 62051]|nr:hypothetical protein K438DRAFT_1761471 [Mycena galopus ATCC 62051]